MPQITWQLLVTAPNAPSAHALTYLLHADGIASQVVSDTVLLGQGQPCRVLVDTAQLHRARRLLTQHQFTDQELSFLATGGSEPDASGP